MATYNLRRFSHAEGLKAIARQIHELTGRLASGLKKAGYAIHNKHFFDTLTVEASGTEMEFEFSALAGDELIIRATSDDFDTLITVLDEEGTGSQHNLH